MSKLTNQQKLEAVKDWLKENNIEFIENHVNRIKLKIDLWLPKLYIAIHVGEDDGTFYKKTYKWCKPFFIRDSETKEFVLEKIQNCAYEQFVRMQRIFEKKNNNKEKKA